MAGLVVTRHAEVTGLEEVVIVVESDSIVLVGDRTPRSNRTRRSDCRNANRNGDYIYIYIYEQLETPTLLFYIYE